MSNNDWRWPQRGPQSEIQESKKMIDSAKIITTPASQRQIRRLKKNQRNRFIIIILSIVVGLTLGLIGSDTVRIPGEPEPYFVSK